MNGRMSRSEARLGVDFGRVINAAGPPGAEDTVFLSGTDEEMLETPAMEGSFEALRRLRAVFDGQVWIVSKCDSVVQDRTERWLSHHRFFDATGIDPDHVRFCRRRADKAVHCEELGITHFVDDRYDVLEHLVGVVPHLFLFGSNDERAPDSAVPTPTWTDAERAIIATL